MQTKVRMAQVDNNPYRDLSVFTLRETTLEVLCESVVNTKSYWENLLGRAVDAPMKDVSQFLTDEGYAFDVESGDFDITMELAYGHHRLGALQRLLEKNQLAGIAGCEVMKFADGSEDVVFTLNIQDLTDPQMLHIQCNENQEDSSGGQMVLMETFRQVAGVIVEEVGKAVSYDKYTEGGGQFFTGADQFKSVKAVIAKDALPGPKMIVQWLGEDGWKRNDMDAAASAVANIEAGYITQEMCNPFPSPGMLIRFAKSSKALFESEELAGWPVWYKANVIASIADYINGEGAFTFASAKFAEENGLKFVGPADRATIRTLNGVASSIKNAKDGACVSLMTVIKTGKADGGRKMSPAIAVKSYLTDTPEATDDDIVTALGINLEEEGYEKIIENGRELFQEALDRKTAGADDGTGTDDGAAGAVGDAPGEAGGEAPTIDYSGTDLNVAFGEFKGNAISLSATMAGLGSVIAEEHKDNADLTEGITTVLKAAYALGAIVFGDEVDSILSD